MLLSGRAVLSSHEGGSPVIVAPDFLDHWKTRLLCELLQDATAPLAVLRLWGHCQNRRTDVVAAYSPVKLKAICQWPRDAEALHNAMLAAEWITVSGDTMTVHEFAKYNKSLFAAWANGPKGGRPRKAQPENPRVTEGKPAGNPTETDGQTDREEKIETPPCPPPPVGEDVAEGQEEAPAKQAITFDPEHGITGVTEADLATWKAAYPAVDVETNILRASEWLKANPAKKKKNIRRFLTNWMERKQERGGDLGGGTPLLPVRKDGLAIGQGYHSAEPLGEWK